MSAIKFPYPEGRYPHYEYPDDVFDLSHQFIERKGFGKVIFCLGVEDTSGLMVAYIPRGVPFIFQAYIESVDEYNFAFITILLPISYQHVDCKGFDLNLKTIHKGMTAVRNPIIIFLSFPMDPTIIPAVEKCTEEDSGNKKFIELYLLVEDDTSFYLLFQAGKPGWFCPDMLAKERKFTRAFLNWMMVKSVVPESPNFKVEVRLGIAVQNAPEREDKFDAKGKSHEAIQK
ncbi:hypothetical protein BS47DRAFT_1361066 [Hydnum rufescens UP504]|uniref:Uncharacterized protein n=1 Tax=Hydnum rufescens UP504 TaxID=1448309 RepID=A0A9P6DUG8_9AGAM|nr:hypothetical protein BS47DRAFT_1361066 [Hydnum rufescens UP504]